MKILFSGFAGTAPKFDDEQLTDGYAVQSVNTRPGRSILEPWKESVPVATINRTSPASIFKYRNKWFSWATRTSAIKVPLKNDPYDYAVIAAPGQNPKLTDNTRAEIGVGPYPAGTLELGVPVPTAPGILLTQDAPDWYENDDTADPPVTGGAKPTPPPTDDEYDTVSVAYAICYIDAIGRLSALSPASERTEIKEYNFRSTTEVTLQLPSTPTGLMLSNPTTGKTAKVRIYRTNFAGGATSVFQFVAEVPHTDSQYKDTTYSGDLGEAPINETWNPPPSTDTALFPNGPMRHVIVAGSDMIVGHNDKLVCFAEPGAFYAYPPEYYKVFAERIVTIVAAGSNIIVLTSSYPYVIQGAHPGSMDVTRLSEPAPCMSELGVTEVFGAVYYAGPNGLWEITGYTPRNATRDYLSDREWADLDPSTIKLANYDGKVFIDSAAQGITYVYDPGNPADGLRVVDQSVSCYAQMDDTNDLAYVEVGSNIIEQFDSAPSTFRPLQWTSKTYNFNEPFALPVLKVHANQYPVDVTIEAEPLKGSGTISATRTVHDSRFVYLPFQGRHQKWRAKVTAVSNTDPIEIRGIQLAQTPAELD